METTLISMFWEVVQHHYFGSSPGFIRPGCLFLHVSSNNFLNGHDERSDFLNHQEGILNYGNVTTRSSRCKGPSSQIPCFCEQIQKVPIKSDIGRRETCFQVVGGVVA
jgi:hypothetical protein